jgi:hypothetical protein
MFRRLQNHRWTDVANCKLRLQIAKLDGCTMTWGFVALPPLQSGESSPLNDANEHDNYSYGKQDVNETTERE